MNYDVEMSNSIGHGIVSLNITISPRKGEAFDKPKQTTSTREQAKRRKMRRNIETENIASSASPALRAVHKNNMRVAVEET
jgi:hypothetical protein